MSTDDIYDPRGKTAREYLRVSRDKSGREKSQGEQHKEDAEYAGVLEVALVDPPYVDTGSAWRGSAGTRGDFERLIADLTADRYAEDYIVLWDTSRGSRTVAEWAVLIDLAELRGKGFIVTTHRRTYDPANPRDRRTLHEDAIDAEYDSAKRGQAVHRALAANAADGKPNGITPYGYQRVYDERTKELIRQERHEPEARVVEELFDRLKKGHSLRSISRDFEGRGVRSRSGKVFSEQHLRDMALRPAYGGYRTYTPRPKNGTTKPNTNRKLDLSDAVKTRWWNPLISEEDFWTVRRLLTRPERKTTRPGRGVHLLSMIAKCDVCGSVLAATNRRNQGRGGKDGKVAWMYQCHKRGCIRIDKTELDQIAEDLIIEALSDKAIYERLATVETDDAELARVRADLTVAQAELDALTADVKAGRTSYTFARDIEPDLRAKVETLAAQETELSTPSELRGIIKPGSGARRRWTDAEMPAKRAVAKMLFSPDKLGELRVQRRPTGRRNGYVPAAERVAIPLPSWWADTPTRTID